MSEWIKFDLVKRPYYDKYGDLLGRPLYTDRYGLDEIYGGGKLYPEVDYDQHKVLERHENADILLLHLDITEAEAEVIRTKDKVFQYQASPKEMAVYNHKDFKSARLTDEEAKIVKEDVFGVETDAVIIE